MPKSVESDDFESYLLLLAQYMNYQVNNYDGNLNLGDLKQFVRLEVKGIEQFIQIISKTLEMWSCQILAAGLSNP